MSRLLLGGTFAFLVCFALWMMFGVIGISIRREPGLNASESGLLTATPVLPGAVFACRPASGPIATADGS